MPQTLMSLKEWSKLPPGRPNSIEAALKAAYQSQSIYQFFDSLCLLIKLCRSQPQSPFKGKINELEQQAKTFAMAIVDAKDENDWNI